MSETTYPFYDPESRPPSKYAMKAAFDAGRVAGYEHVRKLQKWPLTIQPKCPFDNATLAKAWLDSFNETVKKHKVSGLSAQ